MIALRPALAAAAVLSTVVSANPMLQSQQTEAPRFRTGTTLVELTVVALDGDGRPVVDLDRQDIVVTEQGRPREVAFFRFEGRLEKPQGESLAFYSPGQPDGTWHDVTIATKRRGVKLRHRQGYIADPPKPQPTNWSEEQWRWAVASPLGSSVIHLDARLERLRTGEEGMYALLLLIAPDELTFRANGEVLAAELEIVVAEKPPSGSFSFRVGATTLTVPAGKDTADSVVRYRDVWKIKPDTSTIRLLVRDRLTGRFGTLDIPVKRLP